MWRIEGQRIGIVHELAPFEPQNGANGAQQDIEIHPDRCMFDVIQIVLQFGGGLFDGFSVCLVDLSPSSNTWFDQHARTVERDFSLENTNQLHTLGPGSHKTHLPL